MWWFTQNVRKLGISVKWTVIEQEVYINSFVLSTVRLIHLKSLVLHVFHTNVSDVHWFVNFISVVLWNYNL